MKQDQGSAGATIGLLIVPLIMSLAAAAAPVWSWAFAVIFAIVLAILIVYSLVNVITKRYKDMSQRLLHGIIVLNVSGVIMLIVVWRVYNENLWFGIVLLSLFVMIVTLSLKHRQHLNNAIRNPKQYPLIGKIYKTILIVSAILGPASYGISVAMGSHFEADTVLIVFGALLVPFAFLFIGLSLSAVAVIKPQK